MLGLTLTAMTDELREELGLADSADGLVVHEVDETTEAFEKGLRAGDVITEAGQQKVPSVGDLEDRIAEAKEAGRKSLLLLVRRAGRAALRGAVAGADSLSPDEMQRAPDSRRPFPLDALPASRRFASPVGLTSASGRPAQVAARRLIDRIAAVQPLRLLIGPDRVPRPGRSSRRSPRPPVNTRAPSAPAAARRRNQGSVASRRASRTTVRAAP